MNALLAFDILSLFTLENMGAVLFGTLFGMAVGAMPGLGPTVGVAIIMPVTYGMNILPAVLLLVALYQGAEYGGSISAILLGIPGTASASATVLDGNPLARKGFPGRALGYSLMASFSGGLLGGVILLLLMAPLARVAFKFSDPEMFLIAAFGLITVITLGSKDIFKSMISLLLGLLLQTVGTDLLSGIDRFTFEVPSMHEGFVFIAVVTGLFAFSEVLNMCGGELGRATVTDTTHLKVGISLKEYRPLVPTILKSSVIGIALGIIPGLGPSAAAWLAYNETKRSHRDKNFGTGEPLGIASCESANNACVGGALLPLLSMGIPGSSTIAVLASAFLMKGIQPGPQVIMKQPVLIYGILWGFMLAVVALLIVGKFFTTLTARILTIPNYILLVIILIAIIIGSYGARNNMFDVYVAVAFGVCGFLLVKLDYPFPSFLMAFVLGDLIETSFRRSLTLSRGSYMVFFQRPICVVLLVMIAALILNVFHKNVIQRKKSAAQATSHTS
jgi:putative tricarboxylic transport membrane protein